MPLAETQNPERPVPPKLTDRHLSARRSQAQREGGTSQLRQTGHWALAPSDAVEVRHGHGDAELSANSLQARRPAAPLRGRALRQTRYREAQAPSDGCEQS